MSLNPKQKAAVSCDDHCLVVACPGSGKSKVVVTKVENILSRVPNARIVVTTFSREGANELNARLSAPRENEGLPPLLSPEQMKNVYVSTFHSLALAHLKREKIPVRIAKDTNAYLLHAIEHTGCGLSLEEAQKVLQNCKTTPFYKPGDNMEGYLYRTYQAACKRNNVIDFYDIMSLSLNLITAGSMPILNATHMLVDEFQDCDEIQYQYLMAHVNSGKVTVTAVGDDDQAIYAFRNSLGYEGMARFEQDANAVRIVLDTNYRCKKEILVPAERLIKFNGSRMDKKLHAARGAGGEVVVNRYPSRETESEAIVAKIIDVTFNADIDFFNDNRDQFPTSLNGKEWAILARNNRLLENVDALLREFQIPTVKSFKSIFEKHPVTLMLSLMKSFESKDKVDIELLLRWIKVEASDLPALYELLDKDYGKLFDRKVTDNLNTSELSKSGSIKIKKFIHDLNGWAKGTSRGDKERTDTVIASIGLWMMSHCVSNVDKERLSMAMHVLLKAKGTLLERVAFVSSNNTAKEGEGVQLMTMHGSKGLEFNNVWIIAAEAEVIPSTANIVMTDKIMDEERRLMYVAMTRAKDTLYISSTAKAPASSFLKEAKLA
jgi:superfamily I DNA/RNA helicase